MKFLKSPLQYAGGKGWLWKTFQSYLPQNTTEIVSPFVGGGAIEINLARQGIHVKAYDAFEPLVNFWKYFLDYPKEFIGLARQFIETKDRDFFCKIHKGGYDALKTNYIKAIMYFLINRMSFKAMTFQAHGLRNDYLRALKPNILSTLENYQIPNFTVKKQDFLTTIRLNPYSFLFCDPPYPVETSLYGSRKLDLQSRFDHKALANELCSREKWICCYNDNEEILKLYKHHKILPIQRVGDGSCLNKNEVLIFSHDIPVEIPTIDQPTQLQLFEVNA